MSITAIRHRRRPSPPDSNSTASAARYRSAGQIGADGGVTIYTTEWCGVCQRAKAFFRQNGVPFHEWDVEKTDYGAARFEQLGGSGVPLITVGAEKMMGFDANAFTALWKRTQRRQQP
jgi:glutaredoxin